MRKYLIAAALTAVFVSPALAEQFYVVFDPASHKCEAMHEIPEGKKSMGTYGSMEEATKAMHGMKECGQFKRRLRALPEGGARSYLAWIDAMQQTAETSPLQLLFIELRVGLARSAIQAALLLNGGASVALLLLLASLLPPAPGGLPVNVVLLKWAFAIFGLGLFLAGMTFVNAYVAQGAIATGRSSASGNTMRRLGLNLIVASLLLFLAGIALVVLAI